MGIKIGQLHPRNIVHGDLTTANAIINKKNNELTFIDFGLAKFTEKVEDKAVDLHLLDRNLESSHHTLYPEIFDKVVEAYSIECPDAKEVTERIEKVAGRRRPTKKNIDQYDYFIFLSS